MFWPWVILLRATLCLGGEGLSNKEGLVCAWIAHLSDMVQPTENLMVHSQAWSISCLYSRTQGSCSRCLAPADVSEGHALSLRGEGAEQ